MREGISGGFILACSSVFEPTNGIVDGIRTGGVSPTFEYYKSYCLKNDGNTAYDEAKMWSVCIALMLGL
jgi:hypothetical protein